MMPSAKTDSLSSAPPLNRLTSWNRPALPLVLTALKQEVTAFSEIPGVGKEAPSRNIAMIKSVNSSFLLTEVIPLAASATCTPKSNAPTAVEQPGAAPAWLGCGTGPGRVPPAWATAVVITSQLGDGAARRGDLLPGRCRERVRGHPQPRGRVAGTEYLDHLAGPDRALGDQVLRGHVPAVRIQGTQPVQVDHLVAGLEPQVREALHLGQPAVQRHLAALEAGRHAA